MRTHESPTRSFLWHDYETFGTDAGADRIAQFAGIRTDPSWEKHSEAVELFCAPARDMLPHPRACLITGITPQQAEARGVCEAEFARQLHEEMSEPGTCIVGYNNLQFDDEFSRHLYYRNFYDPYTHEYAHGNSRFDLINLVRMCFALRPEGIEWPVHDSGIPSFRLEDLTAANRIDHEGAHDALADVRATINLARLLRRRQPRLVDWALRMRSKANANRLLDTTHPSPVVYTSSRVAAKRGCTSLFLPLLAHPNNRNAVIAFDLMADPGALLKLEPEAIRERVFVAGEDMPEGVERIPLQEIRVNQVPMLAPVKTLRNVDLARIGLEPELCESHAQRIIEQHEQVRAKLFALYGEPYGTRSDDPDLQLYGGGFFSEHDKHLLEQVRATDAEKLAAMSCPFEDPRLPVMLFRYRARNFPGTLSEAEQERWETERLQRLLAPESSKILGLQAFRDEIARERANLADDAKALKILREIENWADSLGLPEKGNTE